MLSNGWGLQGKRGRLLSDWLDLYIGRGAAMYISAALEAAGRTSVTMESKKCLPASPCPWKSSHTLGIQWVPHGQTGLAGCK